MPVTRSQTAALRKAAQSSTNSDPQLGGITNRINNRRFGAINTSKKKKKRRKKGTLSMRKKPTHTKGQGDGCENNPYFASRKAIKQRVYRSNSVRKCRNKAKQNDIDHKKQVYLTSVRKSKDDKEKTLNKKQRQLNLFMSYQIVPFCASQIVLEHELSEYIKRITTENPMVNVYKKKCEFYADRLRFFKHCLNEKLTVNLSGAKSTVELLRNECYELIQKHKIYSEPQVHIQKMSQVLTEIKNPIGIFDTTVAQQGQYSYHYDGVRHQRRKVVNG
eukprot:693882_1